MYEKNDFKMLESIGSALSKDELRVIIGSGENLQVGTTEVEAERGGGQDVVLAMVNMKMISVSGMGNMADVNIIHFLLDNLFV